MGLQSPWSDMIGNVYYYGVAALPFRGNRDVGMRMPGEIYPVALRSGDGAMRVHSRADAPGAPSA